MSKNSNNFDISKKFTSFTAKEIQNKASRMCAEKPSVRELTQALIAVRKGAFEEYGRGTVGSQNFPGVYAADNGERKPEKISMANYDLVALLTAATIYAHKDSKSAATADNYRAMSDYEENLFNKFIFEYLKDPNHHGFGFMRLKQGTSYANTAIWYNLHERIVKLINTIEHLVNSPEWASASGMRLITLVNTLENIISNFFENSVLENSTNTNMSTYDAKKLAKNFFKTSNADFIKLLSEEETSPLSSSIFWELFENSFAHPFYSSDNATRYLTPLNQYLFNFDRKSYYAYVYDGIDIVKARVTDKNGKKKIVKRLKGKPIENKASQIDDFFQNNTENIDEFLTSIIATVNKPFSDHILVGATSHTKLIDSGLSKAAQNELFRNYELNKQTFISYDYHFFESKIKKNIFSYSDFLRQSARNKTSVENWKKDPNNKNLLMTVYRNLDEYFSSIRIFKEQQKINPNQQPLDFQRMTKLTEELPITQLLKYANISDTVLKNPASIKTHVKNLISEKEREFDEQLEQLERKKEELLNKKAKLKKVANGSLANKTDFLRAEITRAKKFSNIKI